MRTFLVLASLLAATASAAYATEYKSGPLTVTDPWSRATPKGAQVAAGYMTITNNGTTPDRLVGGSSDVAGKVEVHEMTMNQGVMKMRPVKGGLEIKPGQSVELKPGSYHLMLEGLKKPIAPGDHIKATLAFEKAGNVNVEFDVRAMGSETGQKMPGMKMPGR
jgi:periplasmic copper chaperone A